MVHGRKTLIEKQPGTNCAGLFWFKPFYFRRD